MNTKQTLYHATNNLNTENGTIKKLKKNIKQSN